MNNIVMEVSPEESNIQKPLVVLTDKIEKAIQGMSDVQLSLNFPNCVYAGNFLKLAQFQVENEYVTARPIQVILQSIHGYSGNFSYRGGLDERKILLTLNKKPEL